MPRTMKFDIHFGVIDATSGWMYPDHEGRRCSFGRSNDCYRITEYTKLCVRVEGVKRRTK